MATQDSQAEDSQGIEMFLTAEFLKKTKGRSSSVEPYLEAVNQLEVEFLESEFGSPQRRKILEALYSCYQFLYTECIMPDGFRVIVPSVAGMTIEELTRGYTLNMVIARKELDNSPKQLH